MNNLGARTKWALGYGALFITLAFVAETSAGPAAAALAALIASTATFAMLPTSLRNLGFIP
jgi:hypothetical protein